MRDRYRLGGVGNAQLLASLAALVRRENDALSDLLAHLAELDQRRLFLELGFPSLFAYCTEQLGFCKSSAGRRIAAARVCRKYPDACARVARGELQLSALSLLGGHLSPENASELFDACRHKTCDQVEELLATRFPKPDVRDSIRRLPARSVNRQGVASAPDGGSADANAVSPANRGQLLEEPASAPKLPTGCAAASATRPAARAPGKLEPLSVDRFGVRFTADAEFRDLLEEVRALASHREPQGDLLSVMKRGLLAYRRELEKERFGVGRKPRRVVSGGSKCSETARRSRRVPLAVAREVYLRDGGRCTFCSTDGRRCGTRRFLELDHVAPWALGGESTAENLRLRCRGHNQYGAREHFGSGYVDAAVARARAPNTKREREARDSSGPRKTPRIRPTRVSTRCVARNSCSARGVTQRLPVSPLR